MTVLARALFGRGGRRFALALVAGLLVSLIGVDLGSAAAFAAGPAPTDTSGSAAGEPNPDVPLGPSTPAEGVWSLEASPGQLAYRTVVGQPCSVAQSLSIVAVFGDELSWSATTSDPWVLLTQENGTTPSQFGVSVKCDQLGTGVHTGSITVVDPRGVAESRTVAVRVVVNPDVPVSVSAWRDGHKGAFSSSTDDSQTAGYSELLSHGVTGTFVMNGTTAPAQYPSMAAAGMELGSHLRNHYCGYVPRSKLVDEIVLSLPGVARAAGSEDRVTSLVWPCGLRNIDYGVLAAEYFLSARGYNLNQLEDQTPFDFMNLKSFNSREHEPFPPADLKTVVDDAEARGKWANLVLHNHADDDGAIAYATTRDVWVAPIGSVVKYILQRDRTVISDYSEAAGKVSFGIRRLALPPVGTRSAETMVTAEDKLTLRLVLPEGATAASVLVAGVGAEFSLATESGRKVAYISTPVTLSEQDVVVSLASEALPVLSVSSATAVFQGHASDVLADSEIGVADLGGQAAMAWTAEVKGIGSPWLSISRGQGVGEGSFVVHADPRGKAPGTYSGSVEVTATGTLSSPRVVSVTMTVLPTDELAFPMSYRNRAELLADGWDFLATSATGVSRDTEQRDAATPTYSQFGLTLPVATGDLWEQENDSRNTVFRELPSNWSIVEADLSRYAPWADYQQAGIVLYDNDDHYVNLSRNFNSGSLVSLAAESSGSASVVAHQPEYANAVRLRLSRSGGQVTASYSDASGTNSTVLGTVAFATESVRLGLLVGANTDGGSPPAATFSDVRITVGDDLSWLKPVPWGG